MLKKNNVTFDIEKHENNLFIIGIAVVASALLFVVVIVVLCSNKKKRQHSNMSVPAPKGSGQLGDGAVSYLGKAMIRSLSTQHHGVSYPIGQMPILIGRDGNNCTIVYREGTPGVSGRHCSVIWDPKTMEFLVTDLCSTYGTFLQNGKKLEPNIPYHLKSGESFYVGEQSNMLCVEVW